MRIKNKFLFVLATLILQTSFSVCRAEDSPTTNQKPWMLGFSIGTPSLVNLEAGRLTGPSSGFRLTGLYTGDTSGLQVGYIPYWKRKGKFYRDLAVVGGHFRWLDYEYKDKYGEERFDEWNYLGFEALFSWRGFFAAPGISIGKGDWNSPFFLLRLGTLAFL